jgi:predicted PurR-regulated permease PerM
VIVLSAVIISALVLAGIGVASFFRNETGGPDALLARLMDILNSSRHQVPALLQPYIPEDMPALRAALNDWAAEHQRQLGVAGTSVVQVGVRVLIGMVLGAMIALYDELPLPKMGPLAQELIGRTSRLATAFRQVVFAQVKISLLNTVFTAIFLLGVLPLFGVHLPLSDAGADHLHRRPAAGGGQHHLQHHHHHRRAVGLVLRGRGGAAVPDRDPQAGVLPQRAHRRRRDPSAPGSCWRCW